MRLVGYAVAALLSVAAAPTGKQVTLPTDTAVPLATATELTSKNVVMGSLVAFVVADDVTVDGVVVIPKGTPATGQVTDYRDRGAMGMSGRLSIRPLYLSVRGTVVRLKGAIGEVPGLSAGQAASVVFNPMFFTGRNVKFPAGTSLAARTEKPAVVTVSP